MPQDAWEELAGLPAESGGFSPVKRLRVEILGRLERWQEAVDLCLPMTEQEPGDSFWWVQGAYAQRRARSIADAEKVLRDALLHLPPDGLVLYNLSCYACVQGRLDEARDWFERSIVGEPKTVIAMALLDPDLEALHPWIRTHPLGTADKSPPAP